ncbi:hypothetical protein V8E36_008388 [Tilletia maclaganii]
MTLSPKETKGVIYVRVEMVETSALLQELDAQMSRVRPDGKQVLSRRSSDWVRAVREQVAAVNRSRQTYFYMLYVGMSEAGDAQTRRENDLRSRSTTGIGIRTFHKLISSPGSKHANLILPLQHVAHLDRFDILMMETTMMLLLGRFRTMNVLLGPHLAFKLPQDFSRPDRKNTPSGLVLLADDEPAVKAANPRTEFALKAAATALGMRASELPAITDAWSGTGSNLQKLAPNHSNKFHNTIAQQRSKRSKFYLDSVARMGE